MKKKVLIQIVDNHATPDNNESVELTTVGTLNGSGDLYSLEYTETDEELRDSTTTLTVEENRRITMTRVGRYNAQMIMERDRRHQCHYSTPYGELMMGVFTSEVHSDMAENGGKLRFRYTIDYNTGFVSTNELTITVKEASGHVPTGEANPLYPA